MKMEISRSRRTYSHHKRSRLNTKIDKFFRRLNSQNLKKFIKNLQEIFLQLVTYFFLDSRETRNFYFLIDLPQRRLKDQSGKFFFCRWNFLKNSNFRGSNCTNKTRLIKNENCQICNVENRVQEIYLRIKMFIINWRHLKVFQKNFFLLRSFQDQWWKAWKVYFEHPFKERYR